MAKGIDVISAKAGSNVESLVNSYDDNELSEWKSDGNKENAWITYQFANQVAVDEVVIKLTGWRNKCYPLAIYAGKKKVWEGVTYATLGYVHIPIAKPIKNKELTIKMLGPAQDSNAFGDVKELAGGNAGELDRFISKNGKTIKMLRGIVLLYRGLSMKTRHSGFLAMSCLILLCGIVSIST